MYFIQKIIFDQTYLGTGMGLIRNLYKKYRGMEHFFFRRKKNLYSSETTWRKKSTSSLKTE